MVLNKETAPLLTFQEYVDEAKQQQSEASEKLSMVDAKIAQTKQMQSALSTKACVVSLIDSLIPYFKVLGLWPKACTWSALMTYPRAQ